MRPVQFLLIILVGGGLVLYFRRLRTGVVDRLVVLAFALLGAAMIIAPDWTMIVANALGVGRGVDLFFYLAILGFAFAGLVLYSKLRDIDENLTRLVRTIAIERAENNDPKNRAHIE
jgi:hypothetical protein